MSTKIPLPRCDKHKNLEQLSILCHTCQRIFVEHEIVTKAIDDLIASGFKVREVGTKNWQTRDDLLALLFDLDDAFVAVEKKNFGSGWVRFVFGNYGYDVIADYTFNLEDVLQGANDLASSFDK